MNTYRYARDFGLECQVFIKKNKNDDEIYDRVNEWCAGTNSVCIELHFNGSENGKAKGTETLWDDDPSDSIEFARVVHDSLVALYNRRDGSNRKLKKRVPGDRGYHNLNSCKVTSCLVEPFFGNNAEEALLAYSKTFEYAKTLASAALKFLYQREVSSSLNLS